MALEIANTIINQLGGNKFRVMTGAKDFVGCDTKKFVQFRLPTAGKINGKKITNVKIIVNDNDLYDVQFWNIRGINSVMLEEVTDVYCDMLQSLFTEKTGLDTHL